MDELITRYSVRKCVYIPNTIQGEICEKVFINKSDAMNCVEDFLKNRKGVFYGYNYTEKECSVRLYTISHYAGHSRDWVDKVEEYSDKFSEEDSRHVEILCGLLNEETKNFEK